MHITIAQIMLCNASGIKNAKSYRYVRACEGDSSNLRSCMRSWLELWYQWTLLVSCWVVKGPSCCRQRPVW